MTVTTQDITLDFMLGAQGFSVVGPECSENQSGFGWTAVGNCNNSGNEVLAISTPALPVNYNQQITSITAYIVHTGPQGSFGVYYAFNTDGSNAPLVVLTKSNNQGILNAVPALIPYGQSTPFFIETQIPVNSGGYVQLFQLVIHVNQDDTIQLPANGDGNTNPPLSDCQEAVTYLSGTGPDCINIGDKVTFVSTISELGNLIDFTISGAVALKIIGQLQWLPNLVTQDPYLIAYNEATEITATLNIISTIYPSDNTNPLVLHRLSIYGPNNQTPFSIIAEIITTYQPGELATIPQGTNFTDILTGLDGIKQAIDLQGGQINDKLTGGLGAISESVSTLPDSLQNAFALFLQDPVHNTLAGMGQVIQEGLASGGIIAEDIIAIFEKVFIDALSITGGVVSQELIKAGVSVQNTTTDTLAALNKTLEEQGEVLDRLLSGDYSDYRDFYTSLSEAGNNTSLIQLLQNGYTLIATIQAFLSAKGEIGGERIKQLMNEQYTPTLLDPNTLVKAYYRQLPLDIGPIQELRQYGYTTIKAQNIIDANRPLPNPNEIRDLYLKGMITQQQHDTYLGAWGFGVNDIIKITENYQILPSPSDITRMADKHIFNTDIPAIFGQYDELDTGYTQALAQLGINVDWTRKLWASHWSLPGLQDTFDMWHRGIIDDTQLATFFELTDILPFFREKLKQLNYNLVSRVDIRRFYADGIYNQQDVYNAYIKLGFSPEDAQKQTQFTITLEQQSEQPAKVKIRTLTETMVVKAYKEGIITQNEAVTRLGRVGYLADDASLILELETQISNTSVLDDKTQFYHDKTLKLVVDSLANGTISTGEATALLQQIGIPDNEIQSEIEFANIERITKLKNIIIENVRKSYTQGQISKSDATALMLAQGFAMTEIDYLFEELDTILALRNKPLTEKDIKDLFSAGIINVSQVQTELFNLGYSDEHIAMLSQLITGVV